MANIFGILVLIAIFATSFGQQRPATWIYGNDIRGRDAKITKEYFQIVPNKNYKFG